MHWKRILLLYLLFSILVGGLLYYVISRVPVPAPLRKDSVPFGAYVIPWMRPNPSVEDLNFYSRNDEPWDIHAAMTNALKLEMTFTISILGETRIIPSTIYLGHDSAYLYVGGTFHGMYRNPTNVDPLDADADAFGILFDTNNDGNLTFPEAASVIGVYIWENNQYVWNHQDLAWDIPTYPYWDNGVTYYQPNAQPAFGVERVAAEYDNVTGTVSVVFSRYLWQAGNAEINALQMRPGERWVMGFLLIAGYTNRTRLFSSYLKTWPNESKTWPNEYLRKSNDSSWWPKIVIDLSNPPSSFSHILQSPPIQQHIVSVHPLRRSSSRDGRLP